MIEESNPKLQSYNLLGITSLFVASKYEEIYLPELNDYIYAANKKISRTEILTQETSILKCLKFEVLTVSSRLIYERLYFVCLENKESMNHPVNLKCYYLGMYILELCLFEFKILQYDQQILASSALFLGRRWLGIQPLWPQHKMKSQFEYDSALIIECSSKIVRMIKKDLDSNVTNLREKYSQTSYQEVFKLLSSVLDHK